MDLQRLLNNSGKIIPQKRRRVRRRRRPIAEVVNANKRRPIAGHAEQPPPLVWETRLGLKRYIASFGKIAAPNQFRV
jgi:hypothetical protein